MIRGICVGIAIAGGMILAGSAWAQEAETKLAVLPTQFDPTAKGKVPDLFDDYLLTAVQNQAVNTSVIGQDDISALIGFEAQKDLMDCSDSSCIADIGGALGVDKLVVLKIALLGEDWVVTAKLINIKSTTVEARVSKIISGGVKDLLSSTDGTMAELFGRAPAAAPPTAAPTRVVGTPSPSQPQPQPQLQPRVVGSGDSETVRGDPGWSTAGGIVGLIGAGLTLTLGLSAVAFGDDLGAPLGGSSLLTMIVFAPIAAAGGSSARDAPGVNGLLAVRIMGWIGYCVTILSGAGMIVMAVIGGPVDSAWAVSTTLLGATVSGLFALDAFISGAQARRKSVATAPGDSTRTVFLPFATVAPSPNGSVAPMVGAMLVF